MEPRNSLKEKRERVGVGGGLESSLLSCQCVYHDPALRMRHTIHILNSCIGPYNLTLGSLWLLIYLCMAVVLEKKKKSIPFGLWGPTYYTRTKLIISGYGVLGYPHGSSMQLKENNTQRALKGFRMVMSHWPIR
jgi:hypothetical protein